MYKYVFVSKAMAKYSYSKIINSIFNWLTFFDLSMIKPNEQWRKQILRILRDKTNKDTDIIGVFLTQ